MGLSARLDHPHGLVGAEGHALWLAVHPLLSKYPVLGARGLNPRHETGNRSWIWYSLSAGLATSAR